MPTTILLVDDHPVFRKGLRVLLEEEQDIQVVGEAGDGQEAIDQVRKLSPDVVIMDITMPNFNGIDATRHIISEFPDTKIIALSIHSGKRFIEGMLRAGAVGYILKESAPEELLNGVRAVMRDEIYLSSSVTGIVISKFVKVGTGLPASGDYDEWMAEETIPIIRTKLHRPPIPETHVRRPRLLEQLEKGRHRQLTLVSAPAGYGKSFLISCWLESCDIPGAWLSLDENDDDFRTFTAYFIAAVETIFPGACRNTQALLNAPNLPPMATLATSLLNELDRIEQAFIMVFDDYYLIKETVVHNLLANILKHPPQSLHLVIVGRHDPPLPISTLRAQSRMTEIRTQDLRFTIAETVTFFKLALGIQIDPSTAIALEEKTEGWVTGLRLAALSMRHLGNLDPKLLDLHVDTQYVMEYLFTEVFSHQPREISQYLLGTAILDRFCGPLCEAVCTPGAKSFTCEIGGWEFIAWLKKENIFVIPLDAENRWFRYHYLFQKFLFNKLNRQYSAEEIKALHTQASVWFAENGLIDEAINHALAGNNPGAAAQLIVRHGFNLINDEQWPRLEGWLRKLPGDTVDKDAELLVLMAWSHTVNARYAELWTCLNKAEALFSARTTTEHIQGHLDALRSFQHYLSANGEGALTYARRACGKIPRKHRWARAFAFINWAGAHQMLGDREKALAILEEAIRNSDPGAGISQGYFKASPCFIYWLEADLLSMLQTAARSLKIAEDYKVHQALAHGLYFMGIARYHRNELHAAEETLAVILNDRYSQHAWNFAHSAFALALIYQAQGRTDEANQVGASVVSHALDTNNTVMLQVARAFQAELALRQGRLAEASLGAEQFVAKPFVPMYRFYVPQLTLVRVLLAQNTTDSREQAAGLLKQLYDFVTFTHNIRFQIDVLSLQALLHDAQGEGTVAIEKLAQALALAEPGGFIRPFVDLGPQMADLLKQLIKQNVAVGYIGRIMAAFKEDEHRAMPVATDHESQSPRLPIPLSPSSQPLVEPLTNRELEILDLVTQRLSAKEIAAKLFISTGTVKKHLSNIYGKLNVSNRRQAGEKAVALGILTR